MILNISIIYQQLVWEGNLSNKLYQVHQTFIIECFLYHFNHFYLYCLIPALIFVLVLQTNRFAITPTTTTNHNNLAPSSNELSLSNGIISTPEVETTPLIANNETLDSRPFINIIKSTTFTIFNIVNTIFHDSNPLALQRGGYSSKSIVTPYLNNSGNENPNIEQIIGNTENEKVQLLLIGNVHQLLEIIDLKLKQQVDLKQMKTTTTKTRTTRITNMIEKIEDGNNEIPTGRSPKE
ncbi:hypothetical protein ACTFIU_002726 [Dictyostelium citrinum]